MSEADDHIAHHKKLKKLYKELLADVPGIEVHDNPDERYDSNFWLVTLTIAPELKIKGQENAYKTIVTGAIGGAAGLVHATDNAHTDCEPLANRVARGLKNFSLKPTKSFGFLCPCGSKRAELERW